MTDLEADIQAWREGLDARGALSEAEVDELESHLRDEIDDLSGRGLEADEAFLVAVKRLGQLNAVAGEYARARGQALWRQFAFAGNAALPGQRQAGPDVAVVTALALLAGLLSKIPSFLGEGFELWEEGFLRNVSFFVFPPAALFILWKRRNRLLPALAYAGLLLASFLAVNLMPWKEGADTLALAALGTPLFFVLAFALPASGKLIPGRDGLISWSRLAGETFIFTCLLWAGVGVFVLFASFLVDAMGIDEGSAWVSEWLWIVLAFASPVFALWLAESKKSVVQNLAPILARIFIIPFVLLLSGFLLAILSGTGELSGQREVLIGFDALLGLCAGLLLYILSSADDRAGRGIFDVACLALALLSLAADAVALWTMGARIMEWGGSPNKVAALGMNIVLLVDLGGLAFLLTRRLILKMPLAEALSFQAFSLWLMAAWLLFQSVGLPLIYRFT